jgi:hypothetical protein
MPFAALPFSSSLSSQLLAREGKSGASSYCLVNTASVRGESATVSAFIRFFMLVQWMNTECTVDRLARVNMIDISQANERECELDEFVFGSKVYRFDPLTDLRDENDEWINVSEIVRPLILLKSKPPKCVWKLIQARESCWEAF